MSEEATRRRNIAAAAPVVPLMRRPFRNFTGWQGLPVATTEEFTVDDVKSVVPRLVAIRGPERTYPADPAVWLNKNKMTQTEVALRLTDDDEVSADVITTLTAGRRLLAHVSRGSLASTRSPAENKLLRGALGRALTNVNARCDDLLIAAVPRSGAFVSSPRSGVTLMECSGRKC